MRPAIALLLFVILTGSIRAAIEPTCSSLLEGSPGFEQALIAASNGDLDEVVRVVGRGGLRPEQRLLLWKIVYLGGPDGAVRALNKFEIPDESKKNVAELVTNAGFDDSHKVSVLHLDERLNGEIIIRALSQNLGNAPDFLRRLPITDEGLLARIAVAEIERGYEENYYEARELFGITSPQAVAVILRSAAAKGKLFTEDGDDVMLFAPEWALLEPSIQLEMALTFAKTEKALDLGWLKGLKLDRSSILAVAQMLLITSINTNGWRIPEELMPGGGDSIIPFPVEDTRWLPIAIIRHPDLLRTRLMEVERRDEFLYKWYGRRIWALVPVWSELRKALFEKDPFGAMATAAGVENVGALSLEDPEEGMDLVRLIRGYSEQNPELLPPALSSIWWDKVRDRQVVTTLLSLFLWRRAGRLEDLPEDSLGALCEVSGLKNCDLTAAKIGDRSATTLYTLLLEIQLPLAHPAFEGIEIEPRAMAKRSEFLRLLGSLRDLHQLDQNGNADLGWTSLLGKLRLKEQGIRADNLDELCERVGELVVVEVKRRLNTQDIEFSAEQFRELQEKWGDLTPMWTLLARFQGGSNWEAEIPLLMKVFEKSLSEEFGKFKFSGGEHFVQQADPRTRRSVTVSQNDNAGDEQLEPMNEAQKTEWKASRNLLKLVKTPGDGHGTNRQIVFSAFSHAPRLLLTVGDLVETNSCQNYRTGNRIETLLGYVVDANVKVLVSWVLKQQDFESAADYNAVLDHLEKRKLTEEEVAFDGNLRVLRINLGKRTIQSRVLGHAYLRQMVKVGQTSSEGVGLRLEKEYLQEHPLLETMRENHQAIAASVKEAIGAVDGESVTMPASRNPGGVYSDLARGAQTGTYEVD
ncbi:MAG: hypothetical protein HYR96_04035 [Deltaproteobacteria bacterium]|nr:hypothetical protein [Deltaproteobacteria bacterium]